MVTREFAVDLADWHLEATKRQGKPVPDPKPGEDVDDLVCVRVHSLRVIGDKIVLEAVYDKLPPLVDIISLAKGE